MIIVVKKDSEPKQVNSLIDWIKGTGLGVDISRGENTTILGLIGDTSKVDMDLVSSLDIVDTVKRI